MKIPFLILIQRIFQILGGLFKICGQRHFLLWSVKNAFPKKQAAYPQVVVYKDIIIHTTADDNDKLTELRFYSYDGTKRHEQFIDGLIQVLFYHSLYLQ